MPLTAADKMRKYRERLKNDPVKREEYLTKERQRWQHRRESGKEKVISELSDRDKCHKRNMRREAQQRFRICRQQQQEARTETAPVLDPTISSTAVHSATTVVQPCSTARPRGRSRVRRDRAKAYRKITALEAKLEETKLLCERYRKRCQWQLDEKEYVKPGQEKIQTAKRVVKALCNGTIKDLVEKLDFYLKQNCVSMYIISESNSEPQEL